MSHAKTIAQMERRTATVSRKTYSLSLVGRLSMMSALSDEKRIVEHEVSGGFCKALLGSGDNLRAVFWPADVVYLDYVSVIQKNGVVRYLRWLRCVLSIRKRLRRISEVIAGREICLQKR